MLDSARIHLGQSTVPGGGLTKKTTSRLLLACVTVILAASQADAGHLPVSGPGGYRYRNAPPLSHGYVQWRYQHRDWARRDWAPRSTRRIQIISAPRLRAPWPVPRCSCSGARPRPLRPPCRRRQGRLRPACGGCTATAGPAAGSGRPATGSSAASPASARGRSARCYSRQFGQRQPHHPPRQGSRGGPHRLVREPRRRAAVHEDAGAVKERFPFHVTPRGGCDATSI